MRALLVQPPLVQLNAPYPAVHYLEAFLRARGHEARARDHSIELYRSMFSRAGLGRIFADARARLDAGLPAALEAAAAAGEEPRRGPNEAERRELERYLSYEGAYLAWIDALVGFLAGEDPALAHRLAAAAELPRGARAAAFLEERGGRIGPDEARALATRILEDLADFIRFALDPEFGTVRYGERLARSSSSLSGALAALGTSYALETFYRPFLREAFAAEAADGAPDLLLLTLPFPGCLLGALACAEEARIAFGGSGGAATDTAASGGGRARGGRSGKGPLVVFGGGYVSTELRRLADPRLFDFCDYLSFDSGYGSLASILEAEGFEEGPGDSSRPGGRPVLHRTMFREGGAVVAAGFPAGPDRPPAAAESAADAAPALARFAAIEKAANAEVFPDYAGLDFGRYLRVVDSANPMHRLWSDSPWLKYHLAHGCYWKNCAFCDVELDYVANYAPADVEALVRAADAASARTGLYGLHFVDEAMPMARLLAFARANRGRVTRGLKAFHYWGNARFDASWTEARCEFLAASGLVAVSGGIEIATERGLEMTDKGFDLAGLVRALVALKRSGILVHAYLIYGFPGQDAAEIVDSAETLRQLIAAGLVDSAFWHRFVLTRHSRLMAEKRSGGRPELAPRGEEAKAAADGSPLFADNDLSFEGEAGFDRFAGLLEAALADWMEGEDLERPAAKRLGLRGGAVRGDLVEGLIERAEAELDAARAAAPAGEGAGSLRAHWLAGAPAPASPGLLRWAYRGELEELALPSDKARRLAAALAALARSGEGAPLAGFLAEAGLEPGSPELAALRAAGLALV